MPITPRDYALSTNSNLKCYQGGKKFYVILDTVTRKRLTDGRSANLAWYNVTKMLNVGLRTANWG